MHRFWLPFTQLRQPSGVNSFHSWPYSMILNRTRSLATPATSNKRIVPRLSHRDPIVFKFQLQALPITCLCVPVWLCVYVCLFVCVFVCLCVCARARVYRTFKSDRSTNLGKNITACVQEGLNRGHFRLSLYAVRSSFFDESSKFCQSTTPLSEPDDKRAWTVTSVTMHAEKYSVFLFARSPTF